MIMRMNLVVFYLYNSIAFSTVLQYAELKPVPCLTYSDAEQLRETCATPILKQVFTKLIHY